MTTKYMFYRLKKKFDAEDYGVTKYPTLPNAVNRAFNGECWEKGPDEKDLVFEVNYTKSKIPPTDLVSTSIPILSDKFIQALNSTGINNLQTYNVTLLNPETADSWDTGFKAVNFIGIVDCVVIEGSTYDEIGPDTFAFKHMVINKEKASGYLCFHVPQAISQIIFSEDVVFELLENYSDLVGIGFKKLETT